MAMTFGEVQNDEWMWEGPWEEEKSRVRRMVSGGVYHACASCFVEYQSLHMNSTDSDDIEDEIMLFSAIGVSILGEGSLGKSTVREKGYSRETLTLFVVIIAAYFVMMIVANFVLKKSTPISFLLTLAWAEQSFDIAPAGSSRPGL